MKALSVGEKGQWQTTLGHQCESSFFSIVLPLSLFYSLQGHITVSQNPKPMFTFFLIFRSTIDSVPLLWIRSLKADCTAKRAYTQASLPLASLYYISILYWNQNMIFLILYKEDFSQTPANTKLIWSSCILLHKLVRVQEYEADWGTNISHHTHSPPNIAGMRHVVLLKLFHTACNETRQRGRSHGKSRIIAILCELSFIRYYLGTNETVDSSCAALYMYSFILVRPKQ